jgi:hypothetical protein
VTGDPVWMLLPIFEVAIGVAIVAATRGQRAEKAAAPRWMRHILFWRWIAGAPLFYLMLAGLQIGAFYLLW